MFLKHVYDRETLTLPTWKNLWSAAAYSPEVGLSTLVEVAANTNYSSQKRQKPIWSSALKEW